MEKVSDSHYCNPNLIVSFSWLEFGHRIPASAPTTVLERIRFAVRRDLDTYTSVVTGRLVFADGRYYEGEFRDDKYCGQGASPPQQCWTNGSSLLPLIRPDI